MAYLDPFTDRDVEEGSTDTPKGATPKLATPEPLVV
jgi:hypothetical protein